MNTGDIQTLYAYNRWANQRLFSALEKLTDEQFAAPVQSSFPSIRESVLHILAAEWLWLKRWKGTSPRATGSDTSSLLSSAMSNAGVVTGDLSTLSGLQDFSGSIERERQEFLDALDNDALHAPVKFNDMAGTPYSEPLVQLLQHLVNHGTYHRGQIITMLRQVRAETVALDMLFFFREQEKAKATANSGR